MVASIFDGIVYSQQDLDTKCKSERCKDVSKVSVLYLTIRNVVHIALITSITRSFIGSNRDLSVVMASIKNASDSKNQISWNTLRQQGNDFYKAGDFLQGMPFSGIFSLVNCPQSTNAFA